MLAKGAQQYNILLLRSKDAHSHSNLKYVKGYGYSVTTIEGIFINQATGQTTINYDTKVY